MIDPAPDRSLPASRWRALTGSLLLAAVIALAAGCGSKKEAGDEAEVSFEGGVEKVFERGPLKVILRLDNTEPTIADRITFQTELTAEEAYEVTPPAFGEHACAVARQAAGGVGWWELKRSRGSAGWAHGIA